MQGWARRNKHKLQNLLENGLAQRPHLGLVSAPLPKRSRNLDGTEQRGSSLIQKGSMQSLGAPTSPGRRSVNAKEGHSETGLESRSLITITDGRERASLFLMLCSDLHVTLILGY